MTTQHRELVQQMLGALVQANSLLALRGTDYDDIDEAITAAREYLDAPATDTLAEQYAKLAQHCAMLEAKLAAVDKVEPVAWMTMWPTPDGTHKPVFNPGKHKPTYGAPLDETLTIMPVYTQPAPQPKAEPVIDNLARACNLAGIGYKDFLRIKAYMPVEPHPAPQPKAEPVNSIKQEAETGLVIGDEIGMRDALQAILNYCNEHLGITV